MEEIKNTKKGEKKPDASISNEELNQLAKDKKPKAVKNKDEAKSPKEEKPSDGRWTKVLGLVLLLSSFILVMAFTSYLFTAEDDQSEVINNSLNTLANNNVKAANGVGRMGAVLAHLFLHNLFGISSYLFALVLFVCGFNLMVQKRVFAIVKIAAYSFVAILWFSLFSAFLNYQIAPDSTLLWGGAFGDYLTGANGWLTGLLHVVGTAALLLFAALIILVIAFNINFDFLYRIFTGNPKKVEGINSDEITPPPFKDEDENIFGKDNLHGVKKQPVQPLNLEIEPSLEEGLLANKVKQGKVVHQLEIENEEDEEEEANLDLEIEEPESEETGAAAIGSVNTNFDPTLDLSNYQFPTVEMLDEHGSEKVKFDPVELEKNKDQIIATLNNYSIEISKIKATIGPTVTLYEIVPAAGVRISKIKNLEDDIALSLAALGIRIIAPIPGKGTIGIEVPNVNKEIVSMRSLLASEKFQTTTAELPICLGKSISNEIFIGDLAKMPHLLMAGATGQGKSVGINAIIVSLLYKKHPSQLKFVLVDPKKVELSLYETLEKHFLAKLPGEADSIITDTKKVVTTLNALCVEMDQRYDLLKKAQCRNLKEYNHKFVNRQLNPQNGHKFLPYIVLVIDEFADLIMTAGKEVEMPIARLAQLARAIGIHLILATQRPSVNIITGTIKANFPARIAFRTTSKIDSRTILDHGGAEQLIGRGDMLLTTGSDSIRLQCGFVDTPEVERIRDFISNQQGYAEAFLLPEYIDPKDKGNDDDFGSDGTLDDLFEDAARVIVQNQVGSTSLIQRRLKLGYNRAGRLMDQLEQAGIVGENLGSKSREVRFKTEAELEQYLQKLRDSH